MKTIVVIPALDEEDNIAGVVHDLLGEQTEGRVHTVIVVDNGSADDTAARAESAGAVVAHEPRRGYGHACMAGSLAAIELGAEIIVYIDADHSSRPSEMSSLVDPIVNDTAGLVLGSRVLGTISRGAMAPHQRFGNWMSAKLMNRLYGLTLTDLGPYRSIRVDVFTTLGMEEMTFGWPTEMTVKCAHRDVKILEVPVSWDPRRSGTSKVSGTVKGSILAARHILGVTIRHARKERRPR